jgi:hypothetical protein
MIKKTLAIACLTISSCYAMEGDSLTVVPVHDQAELVKGIQLCEERFDKTYESLPEAERETVMAYLAKFRPTVEERLKQYLVHGVLTAAYVKQGDKNIAFAAAHCDERNASLLYLDKASVPSDALQVPTTELLMTYILKKQKAPQSICTYVLKVNQTYNTNIYKLLKAQQFEPTDHRDGVHPTEWFQGFSKSLDYWMF